MHRYEPIAAIAKLQAANAQTASASGSFGIGKGGLDAQALLSGPSSASRLGLLDHAQERRADLLAATFNRGPVLVAAHAAAKTLVLRRAPYRANLSDIVAAKLLRTRGECRGAQEAEQ